MLTVLPRHTAPIGYALLLLAIAVPYFVNLESSALWDSNESFYAETPREMLETGNFLAPMFNYLPRPQKPPLTYWWILPGYMTVGIRELGVRLPVAFAVLGTLLFTYASARLQFAAGTALGAVAILATTLRLFITARKLPIDALLLLWLTATAYFLMRAALSQSNRDWLLACACAGLGFLTKGPVAWAIPVISFIAWNVWTRSFRITPLRMIGAGLVLLAVTAPWYVLTYFRYGWLYIADFFLQDNLARFATEAKGPMRGIFYYFAVYGADFFPWSLLTVPALLFLWRERARLRTEGSVAYAFPLIWSAVTFLFFSLSKNKQEYYILPLYPMMAVLLAGVFERTFGAARQRERKPFAGWKGCMLAIAVLFAILALASPYFMPVFIPDSPAVLQYAPAGLLALAAVLLFWNGFRGRLRRCVFTIVASLWLGFLLAAQIYMPGLEKRRPVKEICKAILSTAQPGDEIGYYRAAVPSMVFYLRQPIFSISHPPAMAEKLAGPARVFCVLGDQDYQYFKEQLGLEIHILNRYQQMPTQLGILLGNDSSTGAGEALLLISNRAAPPVQGKSIHQGS